MQLPHAGKRHERVQRIEMVAAHDLHTRPESLQCIQHGEVEGESLIVNVLIPRPLIEMALNGCANVGEMRHEIQGGGGAEQKGRLQQILIKTVTATSKRSCSMDPNASVDVDVAAQKPVRAAVIQHRCERVVRQVCVSGSLGQATEGGELEKKRACSGSSRQVALTSNNTTPQVEATVGDASGGHKSSGKRFAQLRCFPQEKTIVSAAKYDAASSNIATSIYMTCTISLMECTA